MGKEVLAIPEEHLADVIWVIRCGVEHAYDLGAVKDIPLSEEALGQLMEWCDETEEYLKDND